MPSLFTCAQVAKDIFNTDNACIVDHYAAHYAGYYYYQMIKFLVHLHFIYKVTTTQL